MNRYQSHAFGIALVSFGVLAPAPARAASVTQVSRATWGATNVPSYVTMYIYVPDQLAAKPPVVVACHSCGTPVSGYVNSITGIRAAADTNGFIIILPEATGRNCWDVGTTQSLTHDGGGDTQAIAQMVKYVLTNYNGDASRVYALGGSSGAMMTQALMAVYPDVFRAGSARAGVAAGCWADGFATSNQWSNNCAGGNTTKTAQQWGDLVRGMYNGYTGHRPRIQLFHGTADGTINFRNLAESVKEWTNVLGLPEMPTMTDSTTTPNATYARKFWKNACGYTIFETWEGKNGSHSMPYEQDAILAFFGLDKAGGSDPEPDCSGGGMGGMGGAGGSGGGAGGAGGAGLAGSGSGGTTSGGGATAGTGGTAGRGGSAGSGTSANTGGSSAQNGGAGAGGPPSVGGSPGTSGSAAGGATAGSGTTGIAGASVIGAGGSAGKATTNTAGTTTGGPSAGDDSEPDSGGCAFVAGEAKRTTAYGGAVAMGLALLAFGRRRRSAKR